ncbi:hypothetical protein AB0B12_39390, partial [Streptomyces sp. NPDC044780]
GGDILDRSAALVRAGGTLVTIAMPPKVQPKEAGPRCGPDGAAAARPPQTWQAVSRPRAHYL